MARARRAAVPADAKLAAQALIWLRANRERVDDDDVTPELADERYQLGVLLDVGATASVWQAHDAKLEPQRRGQGVPRRALAGPRRDPDRGARGGRDRERSRRPRARRPRSGSDERWRAVHRDGARRRVGAAQGRARARRLGGDAAAAHPRRGGALGPRRRARRPRRAPAQRVPPRPQAAQRADHAVLAARADRRLRARDPRSAEPARSRSRARRATSRPSRRAGLSPTLDPHDLDDRAVLVALDVWGLGALAFDLLADRPPWEADEGSRRGSARPPASARPSCRARSRAGCGGSSTRRSRSIRRRATRPPASSPTTSTRISRAGRRATTLRAARGSRCGCGATRSWRSPSASRAVLAVHQARRVRQRRRGQEPAQRARRRGRARPDSRTSSSRRAGKTRTNLAATETELATRRRSSRSCAPSSSMPTRSTRRSSRRRSARSAMPMRRRSSSPINSRSRAPSATRPSRAPALRGVLDARAQGGAAAREQGSRSGPARARHGPRRTRSGDPSAIPPRRARSRPYRDPAAHRRGGRGAQADRRADPTARRGHGQGKRGARLRRKAARSRAPRFSYALRRQGLPRHRRRSWHRPRARQATLRRGRAGRIVDSDVRAGSDAVEEYGDRVRFQRADVAREPDVRRAITAIVKWGRRLDGVVNNAGIADPKVGPVERLVAREVAAASSTST